MACGDSEYTAAGRRLKAGLKFKTLKYYIKLSYGYQEKRFYLILYRNCNIILFVMLDLKTVSIIVSVEMLCFAFILLYLNSRHKYAGIDSIGIGIFSSCFAGALMTFQGIIPSIFSRVLFGVLTVASMSLINYGFRKFLNLEAGVRIHIFTAAVTFAWIYYFSEIKSDYTMRVLFISAVYLSLFIDNFRILFFNYLPEIKNVCRFTGTIFLFLAVLYAVRAFMVAYYPEMRANFVMENQPGHLYHYYLSLITIGSTFSSLFLTFLCIIFMMTFRMEAELTSKSEKLIALNGDRDRFFSIISHDLVSPFSSIPALAKMMLDHFDKMTADRVKESIESIFKSSERIYSLLCDLLTWSKASMKKVAFEPSGCDLCQIFANAVSLNGDAIKNKSITINNLLPPGFSVYCDANMISVIARNLLSNAVKFTPDGGNITIAGELAENGSLFSVKDSGKGMQPGDVSRLFKAGERVSGLGTRGERGSGIGLLIVKEFVDRHGGEISVESSPGAGATFSVLFPAKK